MVFVTVSVESTSYFISSFHLRRVFASVTLTVTFFITFIFTLIIVDLHHSSFVSAFETDRHSVVTKESYSIVHFFVSLFLCFFLMKKKQRNTPFHPPPPPLPLPLPDCHNSWLITFFDNWPFDLLYWWFVISNIYLNCRYAIAANCL